MTTFGKVNLQHRGIALVEFKNYDLREKTCPGVSAGISTGGQVCHDELITESRAWIARKRWQFFGGKWVENRE